MIDDKQVLFGFPLWLGCLITFVDTFTFLGIHYWGVRKLEALFVMLVSLNVCVRKYVCVFVFTPVSDDDEQDWTEQLVFLPVLPQSVKSSQTSNPPPHPHPHTGLHHDRLLLHQLREGAPALRRRRQGVRPRDQALRRPLRRGAHWRRHHAAQHLPPLRPGPVPQGQPPEPRPGEM